MKSGLFAPVLALLVVLVISCKSPRLSRYTDVNEPASHAKYDVSELKIRDNGRGYTVDFAKLPHLPGRVALVSFYAEGAGAGKKCAANTINAVSYTHLDVYKRQVWPIDGYGE